MPSLICLSLWKYRGLGYLPLFHGQPGSRSPTGPESRSSSAASTSASTSTVSWHTLQHNLDGFREFTWSRRLVEWAVVAGLVGLFRRSVPAAVLIGGWLASYLLIKGTTVANVYGGSFFRYMAPAIPAAFLLVLSIPFLIPIAGRRLAAYGDLVTWPVTTTLAEASWSGSAPSWRSPRSSRSSPSVSRRAPPPRTTPRARCSCRRTRSRSTRAFTARRSR